LVLCWFSKLGFAPFGEGNNRDKALVACFLFEFNHTVGQRVQGVVFANTYVVTGVVRRAALANNDVAGDSGLTAKNLHAESFAF